MSSKYFTTTSVFIFFLLLSACNSKQTRQTDVSEHNVSEKKSEETVQTVDPKSALRDLPKDSADIQDTTSRVFKGLYVSDRKNSTFRPCTNPSKLYAVRDSTQKLPTLYRKVLNQNFYVGESIYVEVKGYLQPAPEGMDSVLTVTEVYKAEVKSFTTDCYSYEFIALGTEPFWSIDIIPVENKIVLKEASNNRIFIFPFKEGRKGRDGAIVYKSTDIQGGEIQIIIRPQKCSDGMSERVYKYSAEVHLGRNILQGCAIKKGSRVEKRVR